MDEYNLHSFANLGSLEIALAISLILFGILTHQFYTYCKTYSDRITLRVFAIAIFCLEILHTYAIIHAVYYLTVTLAGHPIRDPNSYPLTTSIVFETLIISLAQGFFAYRIHRLSGHLFIVTVCGTLSLLRLGSGLALAAESYKSVSTQVISTFALTDNFAWLITLAVTVGAFVDVLVALSLCYFIRKLAPATPSRRVMAVINSIMKWTIQTGLITSIASVAVVITFYTVKQETWFSIYMVLAKLYSNSFFMTLNVRHEQSMLLARSTLDRAVSTKEPTSREYQLGLCRHSNEKWCPCHNLRLNLPINPIKNANWV